MFDFKDKVVFITGGTRGIGRAMALRFSELGAQVVLNYLRNRKAAQETQELIEAAGGKAPVLLRGNIGDDAKRQKVIDELQERCSHLDVLISNAASGVLKPSAELTRKHLDWTMEINAYALLFLTQALVPMMSAGGKIVAVSSLGSTRAFPFYTSVGASKAALESMVRHLSVELAPQGININTLSAGVVDTEALSHFPNREELLKKSREMTPAGRLTTPEDVADVALFLCSPLAQMIHGQTVTVDGGYSVLA